MTGIEEAVIIGAIVAAASTAATVGTQMYVADQQADAAKKQAKYNAQVAEAQGIQAQNEAWAEEQALRRQQKQLLATQEATYAASGVSLEGSPLTVMADTAAQQELDALTVRYRGTAARKAAQAQAALTSWSGQTQASLTRTSGYLSSGSTLLSGASKAYGTYSSSTTSGYSSGSGDLGYRQQLW